MKKQYALIAFFAFALCGAAAQQQAVFSEVNGKVEYQLEGSAWRPAKVGVAVGKGTIISTGFKSSAVLKLGPTTITLKPLTRLTLEDLIKTQGGTQTQLYLLAGRVKADVPPQAGQTTDFRVKSPTATASVRGTGFEFDGINLIVDRGVVELRSPTGQSRKIAAGEFSYIVRAGTVALPTAVVLENGLDRVADLVEQSAVESFSVNVGAPATETGTGSPSPEPETPPPAAPTGTLTITVQ